MAITIILKIPDNLSNEDSLLFNNYISKEVINKDLEPIPATNPPPVQFTGPIFPGDIRGLTFKLNSLQDANDFVEHVFKSGLIKMFWVEFPEEVVINIRDIERLEVYK